MKFKKGQIAPLTAIKKGEHLSSETEFKKGLIPWNKGKSWSKEVIEKLKTSHIGKMSGPNHYKWIKDRTQLKKSQKRNDTAYYEWRKNVWVRDNYTCKINNDECSKDIIAHHILGWTLYPELRYELSNGITLCRFHHPLKKKEEVALINLFNRLIILDDNSGDEDLEHDFNQNMLRECDEADEQKANYFNNLDQEPNE